MKKLFSCLLSLTLLFALVGCGTPADDPVIGPPDDDPIVDLGPDYGGSIKIGMIYSPPGVFNPAFATTHADICILRQVYSGLVEENDFGEFVPTLASDYWYSADGKTLTFKLHEGITFHDGHPLTAQDVAFTYNLLGHPEYNGPYANRVNYLAGYEAYNNGETDGIEGIKIINDYEISFTVKELYAKHIGDRSMGILPKHLLEEVSVADMANHPFNNQPIAEGPFKFVSMARDQHITLEAFDDYILGRPYLDEVIMVIRVPEVALMELETGTVDWINISPENVELVSEWDHVSIMTTDEYNFHFIAFNMVDPRFDLETRKGIAHAINRIGMVNDISHGMATVIDTPIVPKSWAHHTELEHYNYDPDKARQYFADAGWSIGADGFLTRDGDTFEINLITVMAADYPRMAPIIVQNLESVGIKTTSTVVDISVWMERVLLRPTPYTADQYDITMIGIGLGSDPDMHALLHSGGGFNMGAFSDPESDRLLDAGLATVDIDERKAIYLEWQELFNDLLPIVPLNTPKIIAAYNRRVNDVTMDLRSYTWWIPKELQ